MTSRIGKRFKSLLSFVLVLTLACVFTPITASAAPVKVDIGYSGSVKAIYYQGGPVRSASYSITSELITDRDEGYDVYSVRIKLDTPKLTKNGFLNTFADCKKKGRTSILDFTPVFINKNGGDLKGVKWKGGFDKENSSKLYKVKVKYNKKSYSFNWRDHCEYEYKVYVKNGVKGVYVGVAGLRNGQISSSTYSSWKQNQIDYVQAGFGSSKRGFIVAGKII
ncbi:hypothetical protein [Butyrivibrio sp. AE3004]|uniref:hypothetical protein n=1 Tax=Butyrivibrio sp. AE3004 TaxID=1506994 RepID=UPI000494D7B3|nr:hypothetical protein [Butyrivibrio sp. AE3004]